MNGLSQWTRLSLGVLVLWSLLGPFAVPQAAPTTTVDLYGVRTLDRQAILEAVGVEPGKTLTESTEAIRKRVLALPGVIDAKVSHVFAGKSYSLFVGVQEEGAHAMKWRAAPTGEQKLPVEVTRAYDQVMQLLVEALQKGQGGEDREAGHSLMKYPKAREVQELYLEYAEVYFLELVEVLRESADPHQRAVAATVLAYAEDKTEIVGELVWAATDPSSVVRNNAVRALSILSSYGAEHPELGLEIPLAPFQAMIHSLDWTDLNKGSAALSSLTRSRDPKILASLREGSLDAIVEMACWDSVMHAMFAVDILARMADVPDEEIVIKSQQYFHDKEAMEEWVRGLAVNLQP
jgi:hypothetical protein